MWTHFWDMHSGGNTKEPPYDHIYIQAEQEEAKAIFINRFGHDPERVSCPCCGDDYGIDCNESLQQLTAFQRHCESAWLRPDGSECERDEAWVAGKGIVPGYRNEYLERQDRRLMEIRERCGTKDDNWWGLYMDLEMYMKKADVLIIPAANINDAERKAQP